MAKGKPQGRFTIAQIENALRAKSGNVTAAAVALGCSRSTIYRRIEQSPQLKDLITDERETLADIAESALRKAVLDGNITAIIFTLKTVGKSRGYVERQELTGAEGADLSIDIKWADRALDE